MKPPFLRVTRDDKSGKEKTWEKSIYWFGFKVAEWQYFEKDSDNGIGYGK